MDYKSIRFEIFTFMNLMKRKMNASGEKCGMNMLTMPNAKLIKVNCIFIPESG